MSKHLLLVSTYNNGDDLLTTLNKIGSNFPYDVVVHVDGSTDGSDACLDKFGFKVLRNRQNRGIGHTLRKMINYARSHNYEMFCAIAGNNKNDPWEAIKLFKQLEDGNDFIQGSRFLKNGSHAGTPLMRLLLVKFHALCFSLLAKRRLTDALEGFRAYKLSIFDDPNINIEQSWLDTYEMETYIYYKVLALGYKFKECPVSKVYPKNCKSIFRRNGKKYSHIRPIVDWWRILRPIFLLKLGLKR